MLVLDSSAVSAIPQWMMICEPAMSGLQKTEESAGSGTDHLTPCTESSRATDWSQTIAYSPGSTSAGRAASLHCGRGNFHRSFPAGLTPARLNVAASASGLSRTTHTTTPEASSMMGTDQTSLASPICLAHSRRLGIVTATCSSTAVRSSDSALPTACDGGNWQTAVPIATSSSRNKMLGRNTVTGPNLQRFSDYSCGRQRSITPRDGPISGEPWVLRCAVSSV